MLIRGERVHVAEDIHNLSDRPADFGKEIKFFTDALKMLATHALHLSIKLCFFLLPVLDVAEALDCIVNLGVLKYDGKYAISNVSAPFRLENDNVLKNRIILEMQAGLLILRIPGISLPPRLRLTVIFSFLANGVEADFAARAVRRRHEFADGVEERLDALVVTFKPAFEFSQFSGQVIIGCQHPAKADESAHDGDVDLHGAVASQHAGEHRDALLRESVGVVPSSAALI